jgi:hypothetical protein
VNYAVRDVYGRGHVHRLMVGQIFEIQAYIAVVEVPRYVAFDLPTLNGRCIIRSRAITGLVKSSNEKAGVICQMPAVIEIEASILKAQAGGYADTAALCFAGLGDKVDDAAGSIGRQCRAGTTANHFHPVNGRIHTNEIVRSAEGNVAKHEDRQPVFLELNVTRAPGGNGQAANGYVGITAAATGLNKKTWNVAQYV